MESPRTNVWFPAGKSSTSSENPKSIWALSFSEHFHVHEVIFAPVELANLPIFNPDAWVLQRCRPDRRVTCHLKIKRFTFWNGRTFWKTKR